MIGLDVGTGNLIAAEGSGVTVERNSFLTISKDKSTKRQLKRMNIPYVEIDNNLHLVGLASFEYANIFNNEDLRRPMKDGLLNPTEQDALPIMRHLIGSLIGSTKTEEIVVYSIPGSAIDQDREVDYHKDVVGDIIKYFGFNAMALNEAVALGNIGLEDSDLTGIAISLGAGMANVAVMYRGLSSIQFSVAKSGDWISQKAAADTGRSVSKINYIKEKGDYTISPYVDERRSREQQAIKSYYESLIRYILANISNQFENSDETPTFPEPVNIVCGGGTSMVNGFIDVFKEQFTQNDFPIPIDDIFLVDEPLTAVARGCYQEAKFETEELEDGLE